MSSTKKLATAAFLLLVGVLGGRGAFILASGQYVSTPKHSAPVLLTGSPAYCMGAFYLCLAVGLGAAYATELGASRRPAWAISIAFFVAAFGFALGSFLLK